MKKLVLLVVAVLAISAASIGVSFQPASADTITCPGSKGCP